MEEKNQFEQNNAEKDIEHNEQTLNEHLNSEVDTPSPSVETTKQPKPKRVPSFTKAIISNISVAVITSVLTATIITNIQSPKAEVIETVANGNMQETTVSKTSTFKGTDSATIADIAEELAPAIVGVVNLKQIQNGFNFQTQNIESGSGSGVIYKLDGQDAYIITNNHVIEGASKVEVSLYNGERAEADVVGADVLTDLAILKIDANLVEKVASFGDSSILRPGDEVIAIGNPLGLEFSRTVTQGIISATERNIPIRTSAGDWELSVIQTDAAINPGNSGGALINSRGEVIGINSLKISREGVEGLGFAIPSNEVVPIVEELISHGTVKRAYLGIQLFDLKDLAQFYRQSLFGSLTEGIIVAGIEQGSPAELGGLQLSDVIVGINGSPVSTSSELKQFLYKNVKPGEKVEIEYYRDGKKQTSTVETKGN